MKKWWLGLIILAVVIGGIWFVRRDRADEKGAKYRMGAVDKGPVQTVVTATGTASAVTTVLVGSQVSGVLREILVDFNSQVKKGQVIARIDPTFLQAAVAEGNASLQRAQASYTQAERDLARTKDLFDKHLAAQADYDNALTAVDVAKAGVQQAEATLQRARVNLQYAVITLPIDGVVISRAVDVGQTVAASLQAPTLFTIAQDLREMQIATNIDEADIGSLKEGMDATFTVDSYPDETFHGKITQIRYAAQTDQNVVTYPVIITVANPDIKLRPGMTANVTVVTAERADVVRLPATALRFKPPENATAVKPEAGGAAASPAPAGAAATERPRGQRRGGHRGDSTATAAGEERKMATVYVKSAAGKLEARRVATGLNNGTYVELLSGELSPGDSVVVGMAGLSAANAAASRMPGMGGPMGGGPRR